MSDADKAYAAAKRLIAKAKKDGAERLEFGSGDFRALTKLPPEIAGLDRLRFLELDATQIADLSPLAGMVGLTRLSLGNTAVADLGPLAALVGITMLSFNGTGVTDLAPLAGMTAISALALDNTGVSDLTPLAGMAGMTALTLGNTGVTDLTPLAGMAEMKVLTLHNTGVSDLTPLAGMVGMTRLYLNNTKVADLRPLMGMSGLPLHGYAVNNRTLLAGKGNLLTKPMFDGLTFSGCAAAKADVRIAEIAGMEVPGHRAAALFEYLKDWVPPEEVEAQTNVVIPIRQPAPLEVEVTDSRISIAVKEGLPRSDANARAALGWEALREYRQEFAAAFNISNYAPLPSYLAAFDRAMGEGFDPARVVRIGVQAQRFVALSLDTSFTVDLPSGATGDLKMFAAEMLVYLNRFPDWVAYRDDAEAVDAASIREAIAEFKSIRDALNDTAGVTDEVKQEYAAEVAEGIGETATEIEATALTASTREIARAVAEYQVVRQKDRRARAKKGGQFVDEILLGPLGMPDHVALKLEKPMRRLASRFPILFGWAATWYDANYGKDDGAQ